MVKITNEDRNKFFDKFDEGLFKKIVEFRRDKTISRNYRVSEKLHNDVVNKLKESGSDDLTRADVIQVAFIEFAYGDQRKNQLKK